MDKAVHEGHRSRMRARVSENGVETLEPHEVLEYLLFAYVPRKDTNAMAHALINEFGSFAGVLGADKERLTSVSGVTENAALFLNSLPGVFRKYMDDVESERADLSGRGKIRNFLGNKLYGVAQEKIIIAALDPHEKLIRYRILAEGSGQEVALSMRTIVDFALKYHASSIVMAHNHPSGSAAPSMNDFATTKELLCTLASVGVGLDDHYIFTSSEYYSFEESGKLEIMREERKLTLKEGLAFYE